MPGGSWSLGPGSYVPVLDEGRGVPGRAVEARLQHRHGEVDRRNADVRIEPAHERIHAAQEPVCEVRLHPWGDRIDVSWSKDVNVRKSRFEDGGLGRTLI